MARMVIGYACVSADGQDESLQIDAFEQLQLQLRSWECATMIAVDEYSFIEGE